MPNHETLVRQPPRGRHVAALTAALTALTIAAQASAFVAPMRSVDQTRFVTRVDDVQVVSVYVAITPDGDDWLVDAELVLRNVGVEPVEIELAVIDQAAFTDETLVYVDGRRTMTTPLEPRQDPAMPEHTYRHVRRLPLALELGGEAVVRVRMIQAATMDTLGRSFIELPTHALGLFATSVTAGRIRVQMRDRAIALQATITGGAVYDEPLDDATWLLRDWTPRLPFRVTWATPWAALLVVTEVEVCPQPWQVVRSTTQGQMESLRSHLGAFDDATLEFCANLPDVLHGRPFTSEETRTQLAALTLDRYVPGSEPAPLYVPNPGWSPDSLSDAEAIYARALRTVLEERSPRPR